MKPREFNPQTYNPDLNRKPTENLAQLMTRFTKRIAQVSKKKANNTIEMEEIRSQLDYLRGCKDTVDYLMTGKLPDDGNHDGMRDHKPRTEPKIAPLGSCYNHDKLKKEGLVDE